MAVGCLKVLTMSQVLSSIQYICFQKTCFEHEGAQTCFLPQAPSDLVKIFLKPAQLHFYAVLMKLFKIAHTFYTISAHLNR